MKRGNLVLELVQAGCYLKRHGKKHDIYENSRNGKKAPIPRHSEIKESLMEQLKLKCHRDEDKIEFRGAPKTGGYFLTDKE